MDDIFTREMIVPSIIIAIVTAAIVIFVFLMLEKSRAKKGMSKIKNAEDEADKIIEDANKKAIEMAKLAEAERKEQKTKKKQKAKRLFNINVQLYYNKSSTVDFLL